MITKVCHVKAKQMEKQIVRFKDEQVDVTEGNQWTLQLSGTILRADRLLGCISFQ